MQPPSAPRPQRRRKTKIVLGILGLLLFCIVAFLFRPMASSPGPAPAQDQPLDMAVIGGGVMSVTLATYLQELEPNWRVAMFERLGGVAEESSNGWNNAGTGHSGFAELELHARERGRIDRHDQGGADRRTVRGRAPVLGA
ncbi:malate:quinone oxidoreductase [Sphingomonas hankookensis]|uniref:malate:quinone oxidoreductase n=1 Tax=Sphingomonas hankookensis TaxID=563996 RepID=UPI000AFF531F|nr:malate:quinone oxidoreductase [Sphingomonas hankookensis]